MSLTGNINKPEDVKLSQLHFSLGGRRLALADSLSGENTTMESLIGKLTEYYTHCESRCRKRLNFWRTRQGKSEDMMSFSTRLKRVAEGCEFGEEKNKYLRDFFVHSLLDERIQSELWEKPKFFEDVIEATRKRESELR